MLATGLCTENDINGEALSMLLNIFEEFKHLVPKSGTRMKIKSIIQRNCGENQELQIAALPQVLLCVKYAYMLYS